MLLELQNFAEEHRELLYLLIRRYLGLGRDFLLRSDIHDEFEKILAEQVEGATALQAVQPFIEGVQESVLASPWVYFAVRSQVARWEYLRIHADSLNIDEVSTSEYLAFKENRVNISANGKTHHAPANSRWTLEFDIEPFNRDLPKLKESRSIGNGVQFLNRHLSSKLFNDLGKGDKKLLEFLRAHKCGGQQLMLNNTIHEVSDLRDAIRKADRLLAKTHSDCGWQDVAHQMQSLGFEPGWGRDIERIRDSLRLLSDILEAPDHETLEKFLARIPMIFSLLILSPHGFFGQANVLGLPDTGGQVVYILDQVRALERQMLHDIYQQGLDIDPNILVVTRLLPDSRGTTCDQRIEEIDGTQHARILRVPFRYPDGEVIPHWISRFTIWPHLERFCSDVETEVLAELNGRPDLIVGNYSDGNLVASLLSHRLNVTQCNIAHALEKTKYLFSDLYWKENDADYHFACQFTADLIAMNSADFIITSTYQEIAGTEDSLGQYESYMAFTMPDLYRVVNGIDTFDPKFNIVSPGADSSIYFPYTDDEHRIHGLHDEIQALIEGPPDDTSRGQFSNPDKPLLFTMARLDNIKNLTGLVQWYAGNEALRERANLLVIAGNIHEHASNDREEKEQIRRMHDLMNDYSLDANCRWLGTRLDKTLSGELYRYVADCRGAFVQPALFEAFGLTVIEAMSSGLPTFATRYGGPLEIIQDGISGFHIDPNHGVEAAEIMLGFFEKCENDVDYWNSISDNALHRVATHYTWELYARRMMTLSRIYGFWKYVTDLDRAETHRYLEMFFGLQYRPLAEAIHSN